MRAFLTVAAALLFIAVSVAQDSDAVKKDKALIKGTWKIDTFETEQGKNDDLNQATLTFDADKMNFKHDDKEDKFAYTLNPAGQPKEINFKLDDKEFQGIYKLEKELFTICISLNNTDARPNEFAPKSPYLMVTLKQVKE